MVTFTAESILCLKQISHNFVNIPCAVTEMFHKGIHCFRYTDSIKQSYICK